jgi:AraC family ethanolamine operon transcriptional activator
MEIIKQTFTNFEVYNDSVESWNLEYNILSKQDFKAKLHMFTSDSFAVSRITLGGKLVHSGFTPLGYRSIVIPINPDEKFIFYDKGVTGQDLLIFSKDCVLNAVTFNNFDAFVVSIENNELDRIIKEKNYLKCKERFGESEIVIKLEDSFSKKYYNLVKHFLNHHLKHNDVRKINISKHKKFVNQLITELLLHIETQPEKKAIISRSKKDIALQEAIQLIKNIEDNLYTVKDICLLTNVSERTLEYAFKEKYKISPSRFIKAFRLNKVKNELFSHKDVNISTIAGKYHFWHMGQFAQDFRKQFGILPSEILARK